MHNQQADLAEPAVNAELEGLATGVELTLASVLQGIAMAILIPNIADLIVGGEIAKLPYIPASLLLVFIVWVAFISHSLSFVSWPFDLPHNLLYFFVVTAETVLLTFLDRPSPWFLSLIGFSLVTGINHWYNLRLLRRHERRYAAPAGRALYDHIAYDQRASLGFMAGYFAVGLFCFGVLQFEPEFGLSQELGWVVAGLVAAMLPMAHAAWLLRLIAERSRLIEQARIEREIGD
jgi:hypothetical protein